MTIAVCYVSPEGVVFGADSTTTMVAGTGHHYFDHNQKLFEIGENSTLGLVTWGLSGLAVRSHRMLIAQLADLLAAAPAQSVEEVCNRWIDLFWAEYDVAQFVIDHRALAAKPAFDPAAAAPDPNARTKDEEEVFKNTQLGVGFCIGGHVPADRLSKAYQAWFDPLSPKPSAVQVAGPARFYGAPNFIMRLVHGHDPDVVGAILASGKWNGSEAELRAILGQFSLAHPGLMPIRDAIDFVHSSILSTIKGLKFSFLSQVCGGPIELAVITSDRRFRWVRHKSWDSAVTEGEI